LTPCARWQTIGQKEAAMAGPALIAELKQKMADERDRLVTAATAPDINQAIINIGSGVETSIDALIETMASIARTQANILYNLEASGGIQRLAADISKAKQLLKYRPRMGLAAGLRKLLELDPLFGRGKQGAGVPSLGQPAH
jgi:UDP-glucose 4-epimerase